MAGNDRHVLRVGGPDKMIGLNIQFRPGLPKKPADAVGVRLGIFPFLLGRLDHLFPVFIRPGLEAGFIPLGPVETIQRIGHDRTVGMADMGFGVDVINRSGDVKSRRHGHSG